MSFSQEEKTYIQAIEYVGEYDFLALRNAIDKQFSFLQIEKELDPEMNILLKPNLIGEYNPFFAATTNPAVVAAVADWLREHGFKKICIADSPGGAVSVAPDFDYDSFYRSVNYDYLEKNGVRLNRDRSFGEKKTPDGCINKSFHLLNAVLQADYIINIPKLKTHNITTISFGIKNLFGCVPDIQKPLFHAKYPRHSDFCNMLVELAMTVAPNLTVIDAVEIMEGNGPVAGKKRKSGLLLASKDVFSQDYFASELFGIRIDQVEMLQNARKRGLIGSAIVCTQTYNRAHKPIPLLLPETKMADSFAKKISIYLGLLLKKTKATIMQVQPKHIPQNCNGCLRCVNSCPVQAIVYEQGSLVFKKDMCIGCLCCHEICVNRAITIQKRIKRRK